MSESAHEQQSIMLCSIPMLQALTAARLLHTRPWVETDGCLKQRSRYNIETSYQYEVHDFDTFQNITEPILWISDISTLSDAEGSIATAI